MSITGSLATVRRLSRNHKWLIETAKADTDECIPWPFSVDNEWGYGRVTIRGKKIQATHVILELTGHPRPTIDSYHGAVARHSCDNPPCCNPRHLSWGTQQDNIADRVRRGRGRCGVQSDLTPQNVRDIRTLSREGWSLRQLADEYGVSKVAIGHIVRHETWKHVRCVVEPSDADPSLPQPVTGCVRCI